MDADQTMTRTEIEDLVDRKLRALLAQMSEELGSGIVDRACRMWAEMLVAERAQTRQMVDALLAAFKERQHVPD
jgi:hypothetical protein